MTKGGWPGRPEEHETARLGGVDSEAVSYHGDVVKTWKTWIIDESYVWNRSVRHNRHVSFHTSNKIILQAYIVQHCTTIPNFTVHRDRPRCVVGGTFRGPNWSKPVCFVGKKRYRGACRCPSFLWFGWGPAGKPRENPRGISQPWPSCGRQGCRKGLRWWSGWRLNEDSMTWWLWLRVET